MLAAAIVLAAGMAYYYHGILIPLRERQYAACEPRGNWSDLYPRWLGSRELLLHQRNPYSPEVTREIQQGFYGCVLGTSQQPRDQEGFAYPAYAAFLFAPFVKFDFNIVRPLFAAVLVLVTAATVPVWMWVLGMRLSFTNLALALILTMSSFPVLDGLHLQQITLLAAALMAFAVAALKRGHPLLAGALLALAMIKPQLVVFVAAWLLLWSFSQWHARRQFAIAFLATLLALAGGAELLLPGWVGLWRQAASAYLGYVRPSLFASVFGHYAILAGAAVTALTAAVCWSVRRAAPTTRQFNLALMVCLFVPTCFVANAGVGKYNLVLLIPAALWLFGAQPPLWKISPAAAITWFVAVNALLWQWLAAAAVSFAVLALHVRVEKEATLAGAGPQAIVFFLPLGLLPILVVACMHLRGSPARRAAS
jgi:hypothetical protein